jgi:hypothetical protein
MNIFRRRLFMCQRCQNKTLKNGLRGFKCARCGQRYESKATPYGFLWRAICGFLGTALLFSSIFFAGKYWYYLCGVLVVIGYVVDRKSVEPQY